MSTINYLTVQINMKDTEIHQLRDTKTQDVRIPGTRDKWK